MSVVSLLVRLRSGVRAMACIATVLVAALAWPGVAQAARVDLGTAGSFNVFALGDFNSAGSDTEGAVAAAGNVTLSSYSINANNQSGVGGLGLVAGGNLSFNSGSIGHGNAWAGGDVSLANLGFAGRVQRGAAPLSFSAVAQQLNALSGALDAVANTGKAEFDPWGGVTLRGNGLGGAQVFDLPGSRLLGVNSITLAGVDRGQTLIVNIHGQQAGFQNVGLDGFAAYNVLFNFVDATQLTLNGVGVWGSILATQATVLGGNGQVNGNVVVKDWNSNIQINGKNPFAASDVAGLLLQPVPLLPSAGPGTAQLLTWVLPEPGTLALVLPALVLAGAAARRTVRRAGRRREACTGATKSP